MFQHTATRRWLHFLWVGGRNLMAFQHTATRRWLHKGNNFLVFTTNVSTHSHPKVAATVACITCKRYKRFNTQPPEGGCLLNFTNTCFICVSTHSHPKVAAGLSITKLYSLTVSTHSHPKVAANWCDWC